MLKQVQNLLFHSSILRFQALNIAQKRTPLKINMEPKNYSIEKEHHWNHTYIVWVPS